MMLSACREARGIASNNSSHEAVCAEKPLLRMLGFFPLSGSRQTNLEENKQYV